VSLPYPREKEFTIELDLGALAPGGVVAKVGAADAEGRSLGEVRHDSRGTWLVLRAGTPGAARFEAALR
jgi:hypothetical protein